MDLTGIWKGKYHYNDGREVKFRAILLQSGVDLRGWMYDDGLDDTFLGENRPSDIRAGLCANNGDLRFIKIYDSGIPMAPVLYLGQMGRDGQIRGTWNLDPREAGKFTMWRSDNALPEAE